MKKYLLLIFSLFAINFSNAATFTVDSINDNGTGTLRQALLDANANVGPDTILFDAGTIGIPIVLTSGGMLISENLFIYGNDTASTLLESGVNIFTISPNIDVGIHDISFSNASDYAIRRPSSPGTNLGDLEVSNCDFNGSGVGSGIQYSSSSGSISIDSCSFSDAIRGLLVLPCTNAIVRYNYAVNCTGRGFQIGQNILGGGSIQITNNTSEDCGIGISVENFLTGEISNNTTYNNSVSGIEIYLPSSGSIPSIVVSNNTSANNDIGIEMVQNGTPTFANTIIQNNIFWNNLTRDVYLLDDNVNAGVNPNFTNNIGLTQLSDFGSVVFFSTLDPLLDAAGPKNNGGYTPTISIGSSSLSINNGTATNAPLLDQRGFPRLGATDIGAYEFSCVGPVLGTDTRTECNGFNWIDGNTYTASNNTATFNIVSGAANGCDSLVTLDLTILPNSSHIVLNSNDSGLGSLRDLVAQACPNDTIRFDATTDGNPIVLSSGAISIIDSLYIIGNGTSNTTIDGNGSGVFALNPNISMAFNGISFSNFSTAITASNGVIGPRYLTVKHCDFSGTGIGSGVRFINPGGSIEVENCNFSNILTGININCSNALVRNCYATNCSNTGIFVNTNGTNCVVSNNTVENSAQGFFLISNSTSTNYQYTNNTASNNTLQGFLIYAEVSIPPGGLVFSNNTAVDNQNGLYIGDLGGDAENALIQNNILWNNSSVDFEYDISSGNNPSFLNNIGSTASSPLGPITYFSTANPLLDPLGPQNNGGLTPTISLGAGSMAINNGLASNAPLLDQRGFFRNGNLDIGSYEFNGTCPTANGTDTRTECSGFNWIDGNTYTANNNTATFNIVGGAANGCDSLVTLDLTINPLAADFNGAPLFGCGPLTVNFTDNSSASGSAIASWFWDFGDGDTSILQNPTHVYSTSGTYYTVSLTITNMIGCVHTETKVNHVYVIGPNVNFGADTLSGCSPLSVEFRDSTIFGAPIVSWNWAFGDGGSANLQNPTHIYSTAGIFDVSLTVSDIDGCSRTFTRLQYINNSGSTGTDTQTACDSLNWIDGNTYTVSNNTATFNIVGGAANGCDSLVTLDLTINNTATATDVLIACDSLTWIDGNTYTASNNTATFNIVGGAANGCDSLVTLDLTINNATIGTDTRTECDSLTWIDGNTYTANNNIASFNIVGGSSNGCDSLVTLDLTINNSTTGIHLLTACDSLTWIDGNTYIANNNTATFNIVGGAANGCDSLVTLNLMINNSTTGTDILTACDSLTWIDGISYTASNNIATFNIVGGAANGCDSLVTLDLTINNAATGIDLLTACDSLTWIDGVTYTASINTATFNIVGGAANGCDSLVTLDLTINNTTNGTDIITACDSLTWIDGNSYTASNNTATFNIAGGAANGCDSLVTLNLTINNSTTGTDILTACDSLTWIDGITYTANNITATFNIAGGAANGCDSLVTLNLTINNSTTGTDILTACDSLTWIDGITYTASNNIATFNIAGGAANGCDSLVTLDLTIINSANGIDLLTACDSLTWIDGNTYTASNNTATFNIPGGATNGCDSLVTLDLTINNSTNGIDLLTACDSLTWIDGNTYTASNNTATFSIVGGAANGCDSLVTLDLMINNSTTGTDILTACDSLTWIDGNTYTASNNTATFNIVGGAANGCDSLVTLDLTINNSTTGTDILTACDSLTWIDGISYTASNNIATFNIVGGATNGCDSLVTLDLTINNSTTGIDLLTACDSLTWIDGNTYTASNNTATFNIAGGATNGCDSLVTLDLTINTTTNGIDIITACDSLTWIDGNTYTASNNTATFNIVGGSANACDSLVSLDLTINNSTSGTDIQTACNTFTWIDGNTYTASNNTATFNIVGGAANACDSLVSLDLTINNSTSGTDIQTACNTFTWIDGNAYTASNNTATFNITGGAANGCDSLVNLDLTVVYDEMSSATITECDAYTWIDGTTYTSSVTNQTFTVPGAATNGCDSVYTLNLNILPSLTDTAVITVCDSFTWIDGNIYGVTNNTASYTELGGAANGCDLTTYLDLTVLPSVNITIVNNNGTLEAPAGFVSYTWVRNGAVQAGSSNTFTPTTYGGYVCIVDNGLCVATSNMIVIGVNVGIKDQAFNNLSVYPNPAKDFLHIDAGTEQLSSIRLLDLNGRLVMELDPNQQEFDMSPYASGLYFIQLMNDEHYSIVKLILE